MLNRSSHLFLTLTFAAILVAPGMIQLAAEWQRGERPQSLDVLTGPPTPARLHAYEQRLETESVTIKTLRPWMQYVQFAWFGDTGSKSAAGGGRLVFLPRGCGVRDRAGPAGGPGT